MKSTTDELRSKVAAIDGRKIELSSERDEIAYEALVNGNSVLLLVDPTDPGNIVFTTTAVPALVDEMSVSNGILYTASSAGLAPFGSAIVGTLQ